jgi:hypothetical protein
LSCIPSNAFAKALISVVHAISHTVALGKVSLLLLLPKADHDIRCRRCVRFYYTTQRGFLGPFTQERRYCIFRSTISLLLLSCSASNRVNHISFRSTRALYIGMALPCASSTMVVRFQQVMGGGFLPQMHVLCQISR